MNSDPIKLIQSLLPKSSAATPKTTTAATTSATANSTEAYRLSPSLADLLAKNTSATVSSGSSQGLKEYFQKAHEAQVKAASNASPKPLDALLSTSQAQGTNTTTPSAEIKNILKDKKATTIDANLSAIDARLAQTIGISRAIGTA